MSEPERPAKVVACPSCGASITLRALGQSVMVACASCRTQLDVSRPDIQIIQQYRSVAARLILPLGSRGPFKGRTYEVVGAMARSVSGYQWHEYLLFNPYVGFRWLVYDGGHWNFGEMVKDTSKIVFNEGLSHQGLAYRKFQEGRPKVVWVIGEFYWRVRVGEEVRSCDYVAPPYMLSLEETPGETTWTLLEYVDPREIKDAFGIATPPPKSISCNQPNPASRRLRAIMPAFLVALAGAIAIQIVTLLMSQARQTNLGAFTIPLGKPEQQVFGPLTFTASRSLNELRASAALDNDWVELDCSLVDAQTGASRNFTNAFSYYSGSDSDGDWSEGDRRNTSLITDVPAGTYNLVVEGASGHANGRGTTVHLELRHDVAPWRNFWLGLLAICAYPVLLLWRRSRFEAERWEDSHFGPGADEE
jgi:hypothetical protein